MSEVTEKERPLSADEAPEFSADAADQAVAASAEEEPFDAPVRKAPVEDEQDEQSLVVNLDGYEGPLHLLLDLARAQKVDLRKISMLALVEQYLVFVESAKQQRLELAADYLVMAAWLAYLKSKLLLPVASVEGDEPTADEMAARLAFQLQRLEAMRKASDAVGALPQLGLELFTRGAPEGVRIVKTPDWQADLYELLQAYARQRVSNIERNYKIEPPKVFSIEAARERLARILGDIPDWVELRSLVIGPAGAVADVDAPERSVVASAFNAALEFAKNGRIDLRQLGHYEPIYIRKRADDGQQESEAPPQPSSRTQHNRPAGQKPMGQKPTGTEE